MTAIRLARRCALAGFAIPMLFFLFWVMDGKFNFFHLPTADFAYLHSYSQPASRAILAELNFVFCPRW